ncbi:hypothetical protein ACX0HA_12500 [Flavobacterium hauense]
MVENRRNQLLFAMYRAFLFNITFYTRLICAEIRGSKLIIWVYLDRMPTDHEKDVYYSVCAELTGTFMDLDGSLSEVYFLTDNFNEDDFKDKLLIFARCNYLDVEGDLL